MIVNCQRRVPVKVAPLALFFERVRRELNFPESGVTVRLISDSVMARLNFTFRGKRGPTDVLSFPADSPRRKIQAKRSVSSGGDRAKSLHAGELYEAGAYVGDIAISPQTAARNARGFSRNLPAELRILILHGMIHLAGYDHETDHGEMNRFEQRLRRKLNLERKSAGAGKRSTVSGSLRRSGVSGGTSRGKPLALPRRERVQN
jgi:probable rRNA maturation factor